MRKWRILSLVLFISVLMTALPSLAEGLPVYFQRDDYYKPEFVQWVDESPFDCPEEDLLQIDFVGIRQGDCIIISYKGKRMLVDGGENFRFMAVEKYMIQQGITRFDYFFLTHAHDDHIGLPARLLNHGYIPDVQYSPYDDTEKYSSWTPYVKQLKSAGVEMVKVSGGDTVAIMDGVTLQFWQWPQTEADTMNDHSAVAMVCFGDARMLLTGDICGNAQRWLAENYTPEVFKCDIMKSPHHGNTVMVQEFLTGADPTMMVITNPRSATKSVNNQLDKMGIAHVDITYTLHCQTDGKVWYLWREEMPK